ncbi:alginate lyase family protein [Bradyrhizobium sp. 2TAF24]
MLLLISTAPACEVPPPLASVDVPGFYDDPEGYGRAIAPLHAFIDRVNKASDAGDVSCLADLLGQWAHADALMAPLRGYQGYYERSWAGTDFALVLLRIRRAGRPMPAAMPEIVPWLVRIAAATRDADAINHLHNNLVYWAGLNLAAIGTLADRPDLVDAGIARAREGIRDIQPDGTLARELKRGERALHYHNFALIPLVFTAELARARGVDLYAENNGALRRLADLVIRAVIDPNSFSAYLPTPQKLFPWTFTSDLAWLEPYQTHVHDPQLLALMAPRRPFINLRLGGDVTAAWAKPPLAAAAPPPRR